MKVSFHSIDKLVTAFTVFITTLLTSFASQAQQPVDWQMGLQNAVTPIMERIVWLNWFTLVIITLITLFVLALLVIVFVRYNATANPVPSKTSHNTTIEIIWTVVPIIILLVIVAPSIRLLYAQMEVPEPDVTVKVIGYQWYWGYEYPDYDVEEFTSIMLRDDDPEAELQLRQDKALERGEDISNYPRLLAVDNEMVVPVGKVVRLDITSGDVLHAVAMPSFGVKMDAVPGRLNTTWFKAEKEGLYYGQCSQICGSDHAFMPLAIRVVDEDTFEDWAASASEDLDIGYEILAADIRKDREDKIKLANK
ncbi:MAG: cytochrome c oxidase subunit II [Pseudomonadota bacterium]